MRYSGTYRQRNGRIVARLGLKPEAALASPEGGWGLQGCLVASYYLLEGLCEVFLQENRCCQNWHRAMPVLQPRSYESILQILSAMQMCVCLQKRIRRRAQLIFQQLSHCSRAGRTCAEEAPYHFQSCEDTCCIWVGQSPLWLLGSQNLHREQTAND